jgi:GT2 family glycosyltransferase
VVSEASERPGLPPNRSHTDAWGLTQAQRALLLDPERHLPTLSSLAADALIRGEWQAAYALADRLVRLSAHARARGLLVRAEAARRLGDLAQAKDDIARALAHDPTDTLVNLHALGLMEGEARLAAAQALIDDQATAPCALRLALAVLMAERGRIIARIETGGPRLYGFVAWPAGRTVRWTLESARGSAEWMLVPDASHPLASPEVHVATIDEPRPDVGALTLHFSCLGGPPHTATVRCPSLTADDPQIADPVPALGQADLNVIVPVYEDAEATRLCLDSLEAQDLPGKRWRILVIDDASPNTELVADVARRAAEGRLTLLTNRANEGYAAAINRAARAAPTGDLLLLNADTLLPEGALRRLVAVVDGTPDLGTLTPVSNNGVVTSFPKPYTFNDLPPPADLCAWDAAARAADVAPVAIPNGIGFCLYVTRACWTAVGGMPLAYGRGYYEDVELCLNARLAGFRNLCAMNVVVGHAGSRSFGTGKRRLVMRNAVLHAARFPDYQAEIDAFQAARSFRAGFALIERGLAPPPYDRLVLNPLPAESPALTAFLAREERAKRRVLLLEPEGGEAAPRLRLRGHEGGLPQSLSFSLNGAEERRALRAYLKGTGAERLILAAPERCREAPSALAFSLGCPVDLLLAGPLPPEGLMRRAATLPCADGMTFAAARANLAPRLRRALRGPPLWEPIPALPSTVPASRLGILSPVPRAEVSHLALAIGRQMRRVGLSQPIVILGSTMNDLTHWADRDTFVTGPIPVDELGLTVARFGCAALVLPYVLEAFDCLEAASAGAATPRAYVDCSGGAYAARPGDLTLDPRDTPDAAAARIVAWLKPRARIAA